ncbi:MAG: hypothetical protein R3E03_00455 [Novosphingobium sp.]
MSHVFNFEPPNVAEQYVHRIGRTARRGRWRPELLRARRKRPICADIERLTGVKLGIRCCPRTSLQGKPRACLRPRADPAEMEQTPAARNDARGLRGLARPPRRNNNRANGGQSH